MSSKNLFVYYLYISYSHLGYVDGNGGNGQWWGLHGDFYTNGRRTIMNGLIEFNLSINSRGIIVIITYYIFNHEGNSMLTHKQLIANDSMKHRND